MNAAVRGKGNVRRPRRITVRASHGHGKTACPMERTPTATSPVSSLPPCFIAMPGLPRSAVRCPLPIPMRQISLCPGRAPLGSAKRHSQRLWRRARWPESQRRARAGRRHDGAVYPERTVNKPSSHPSSFHKDESEGTYDWILDEFACPPLRLCARSNRP